MATKGLGSTVVLNVLLWLSLVISIPLAGFHPIYVTVAVTGAVVLLGIAALAFGITRQSKRASRILCAIGNRIPGLTGDRLEQASRDAGNSLSALARGRADGIDLGIRPPRPARPGTGPRPRSGPRRRPRRSRSCRPRR
jgi:hypothetical protein